MTLVPAGIGAAAAVITSFGLGPAAWSAWEGPALAANAGAAAAAAAASPASCEYWTTDEGVSAVVVTSGVNCGAKSFTISVAPYNGAVFTDDHGETAYNEFLSQITEFVHGPAGAPAPFGGVAPPVKGLTLVASADNAVTNRVAVYVYKGPGDVNDQAAEAITALIHNTFVQQM